MGRDSHRRRPPRPRPDPIRRRVAAERSRRLCFPAGLPGSSRGRGRRTGRVAVAGALLALVAVAALPPEAVAQTGTAMITAQGVTWHVSGPTQVAPGDRATFSVTRSIQTGGAPRWAVRGGEKPDGRYRFARRGTDCDNCLGFLSSTGSSYRANADSTWAGFFVGLAYGHELRVDIPRGSSGGTFEFGFANDSLSAWVSNSTRFTVTVPNAPHVLTTAISSDAGTDAT